MKTFKSKKLIKQVRTVCTFNAPFAHNSFGNTKAPTGDPTNTTVTTITTINTHLGNGR
jgi:hypothetical protein